MIGTRVWFAPVSRFFRQLLMRLRGSARRLRLRAGCPAALAAERYQRTFNMWVTGIYETTVDAKYVTANPALARMFGYDSPAEMMSVIADADTGCYVQRGRRAEFVRLMREQGEVMGFESEMYRKNRSRFWMSEDAIAVRDSAGKVVGFYGTIIDISARKRAEEASRQSEARLRASEARLQWLDALRRELVANVSHDLRTPLTALRGYVEQAMKAQAATPVDPSRTYLDMALGQADRLGRLVTQLFELATLESEVQLRPEHFSICDLAHDVAQGLLLEARQRGVTIAFGQMDDVLVGADIGLMERVLQNLFDNGVRHTRPGTVVTMSCVAVDGAVAITIADSGQGMAAKASKPGGGTGLGLAIVRRILALHDTELLFETGRTGGVRCRFRLPVSRR